MKPFILIFFVFLVFSFTHAQEAQDDYIVNTEKFKITEINIFFGTSAGSEEFASQEDFLKLAPQSKLLQQNLDGYSSSYIYSNMNFNNAYAINLGISFPNKTKTNYNFKRTLRLGISGYNYTSLGASFYKETRVPYDTLSSGQSGQTIYIDSVYSHLLDMSYSNKNFRIDINYVFKRNPHKRFNVYGGVGFNVGFCYGANTFITDTKTKEVKSYSSLYVQYGSQQSEIKTERIRNKSSYGFSAYIPFGLDLRLGKKSEFWRQFHIIYEIRPGMHFINIPAYGNYLNTSVIMMFGVRACFD